MIARRHTHPALPEGLVLVSTISTSSTVKTYTITCETCGFRSSGHESTSEADVAFFAHLPEFHGP